MEKQKKIEELERQSKILTKRAGTEGGREEETY